MIEKDEEYDEDKEKNVQQREMKCKRNAKLNHRQSGSDGGCSGSSGSSGDSSSVVVAVAKAG